MDRKTIPYEKTVFVCTNVREDGRVACANPGRGGTELCATLKEEIKKAGLKNKIRVARSGCLDLCEKGPNLFIFPSREWICGAKTTDLPQILDTILPKRHFPTKR